MGREIVGTIDGNDVIYVPEKDIIFCKNTTLPFKQISDIVKGSIDITEIEDKNLTIQKDGFIIKMGCLITTTDNCKEIIKTVNKNNKNRNNESKRSIRVNEKSNG